MNNTENNTWQNPYHMPYHPECLQARGLILVEGDKACDTDFAMFYTLYCIFNQETVRIEYKREIRVGVQ